MMIKILDKKIFKWKTSDQIILRWAIISTIIVFVWVVIGYSFDLDANQYLILGIPILILYQWFLRKKPLVQLWMFDSTHIGITKRSVFLLCLSMIIPTVALCKYFNDFYDSNIDVAKIIWLLAALFGSLGVAITIDNAIKKSFWKNAELLTLVILIIFVGVVANTVSALTNGKTLGNNLWETSFNLFLNVALYSNVGFVLEEVVFRGGFDAAILGDSRPEGKTGWWVAFYVSLLWGIWHIPILIQNGADAIDIVRSLVFHIGLGIPLSILVRRTRSIGSAVFAHAFIDGWRNIWLMVS
ncbi:CPBP family intramembrane glutamic endopeptidase [Undibacterium sp. Ji67W]|uniref:CPBP family intramembrane glutamic endopeptidase n=1 Tax=Undibacterium sp. Ji67W TaxID=3413042 RepID=UPI003BF4032A